jgi:hypothetical protein
VNEKSDDHCLDIITAMANQELTDGTHFDEYRGGYLAILDQVEIREFAFHFYLLYICPYAACGHFIAN